MVTVTRERRENSEDIVFIVTYFKLACTVQQWCSAVHFKMLERTVQFSAVEIRIRLYYLSEQ